MSSIGDGASAATSASAFPAQPAPAELAPPQDDTVVEFSFASTATALVAGSNFWLAARFEVAPGYRIFWTNPGVEGRPTTIEFRVPEGFEVSRPRLPPPTKSELPDGGLSYHYARPTAAFAEVRVAPDLDPDRSYRFEVDASWLACEERCYPESTSAFIELGVSDAAESAPFDAKLQELFQALPRPLDELAGVSYRWRSGGRLHLSAAQTTWLDFLPARAAEPKLVNVAVNHEKSELRLRFEDGSAGARVRGLAVAESDQGPSYFSVDIPWPEQSNAAEARQLSSQVVR